MRIEFDFFKLLHSKLLLNNAGNHNAKLQLILTNNFRSFAMVALVFQSKSDGQMSGLFISGHKRVMNLSSFLNDPQWLRLLSVRLLLLLTIQCLSCSLYRYNQKGENQSPLLVPVMSQINPVHDCHPAF
jgi:hypothetical protein